MIANRKEFDGNWKCVSTTLQFRFHVPQTGDPPHCLLNLLLLHYNPGKCKFSRLWLRLVVSDWSLGYPPVYFGSKMRRSKVQRARSQIASWLERTQRHCGLNESTHFICQDYGSELKTQTTKKTCTIFVYHVGPAGALQSQIRTGHLVPNCSTWTRIKTECNSEWLHVWDCGTICHSFRIAFQTFQLKFLLRLWVDERRSPGNEKNKMTCGTKVSCFAVKQIETSSDSPLAEVSFSDTEDWWQHRHLAERLKIGERTLPLNGNCQRTSKSK